MELLKPLFSFEGRVPRSKYWYHLLAYAGISVITELINVVIESLYVNNNGNFTMIGSILNTMIEILLIIVAIAGWAISVKRCHDRDHSGWFLLITLIPFVGWFWELIELGLLKGTEGENKYGPDPTMEQVISPL